MECICGKEAQLLKYTISRRLELLLEDRIVDDITAFICRNKECHLYLIVQIK